MLVTKTFLDEDFLLQTDSARTLYHEFAKQMPIIDYHNHLPPDQIVADKTFENLTQIWLYGDHYKWRAMRTNGIHENYCTGDATDYEKFEKWAETVPYTLRNPLYHWTHLELQRYFDVHEVLNPRSARRIYDECSEKLRTPDYSVRNLLRKMNVEVVCTTDDPLDTLEYHQQLATEGTFEIQMRPAFRPDKFILIGNANFATYLQKLGTIVGFEINRYDDLTKALRARADVDRVRIHRVRRASVPAIVPVRDGHTLADGLPEVLPDEAVAGDPVRQQRGHARPAGRTSTRTHIQARTISSSGEEGARHQGPAGRGGGAPGKEREKRRGIAVRISRTSRFSKQARPSRGRSLAGIVLVVVHVVHAR